MAPLPQAHNGRRVTGENEVREGEIAIAERPYFPYSFRSSVQKVSLADP